MLYKIQHARSGGVLRGACPGRLNSREMLHCQAEIESDESNTPSS
jgi:hypothetical protein